jgi:hypothetical protein
VAYSKGFALHDAGYVSIKITMALLQYLLLSVPRNEYVKMLTSCKLVFSQQTLMHNTTFVFAVCLCAYRSPCFVFAFQGVVANAIKLIREREGHGCKSPPNTTAATSPLHPNRSPSKTLNPKTLNPKP